MDVLAVERRGRPPTWPHFEQSHLPDNLDDPEMGGGANCALLALGQALRDRNYHFTTITPLSHHRVNARVAKDAPALEDVFGWNRSFSEDQIPGEIANWLRQAGALELTETGVRSGVRFSTIGDQLFVHSAFPTDQGDAVFFGPDTYRFARAIKQLLGTARVRPPLRIADIGAGSGAGGLYAARLLADMSPTVLLSDINQRALQFSRINGALNALPNIQVVKSDLFASVEGNFDLIISNPPYLVDPLARLYRHGGGDFGSALSLDIVTQGIEHLAPGGRLLLYTGSAIVAGVDAFHAALHERLAKSKVRWTYDEIDPDVFGEELEHPPYDRADRIAVVAVMIELA